MAALNEIRVPATIVIPISATTRERAPDEQVPGEDHVIVTLEPDFRNARIEVDSYQLQTGS